jgi:hypothetical protein
MKLTRLLINLTAALGLCGVAYASTRVHLFEPAPPPGMYPIDLAPYTFATGWSPDGNTVEGVCGYNSFWNVRGHAWYQCSWPLVITPVPGGYTTVFSPPVLGPLICCDNSGTQRPPRVVYGPFTNYAGYVVATPINGGPPYVLTP